MKLSQALAEAVRLLRSHRIGVPDLTARVLLADVLERDQAWLAAHSHDLIDEECLERYWKSIRTRCTGVPTQYIRGFQEFYGYRFRVTPDVLIPRPETEHLVEAALRLLHPGQVLLDLGTGSGAIAVSIAKEMPGVVAVASDISAKAVRVAQENARSLGASVRFCVADMASAFVSEQFDVVISNPPYVPLRDLVSLQRELRHEPSVALYGGEDGLGMIERLARETPCLLKPGGWLLAEIGYKARPEVEGMLDRPEWAAAKFTPDLAGIDRVVAAQRAVTWTGP